MDIENLVEKLEDNTEPLGGENSHEPAPGPLQTQWKTRLGQSGQFIFHYNHHVNCFGQISLVEEVFVFQFATCIKIFTYKIVSGEAI